MYKENSIPNEWRKSQYLRKVTEGNPETTEELVFLTPPVRYALKFFI
jgi:hypothetical protein